MITTPRLARLALAAATAVIAVIAVMPLAPSLGAQATPRRATPAATTATPVRVTSVEGITEYRLANGLRVLLFPDASKPTATVNVTYMVGSRHEGYGETGMAHLLEHLLFKGTPTHRNIPQELTEHGSRPNGTTWFDRTNYFETVPATDANLEWALDLEADRMVNSFVARKDLDSEMTVVRNEFESGENNPFGVLLERTMSTAYLWHNYGNSTIGARADLENVPIERLQAFYRRFYQPDNALLVVAGKFDEARTLRLIQQKFGRIAKPARSLERGNLLFPTYTAEPTQDGERAVTLRRVGDVQAAMAVYHVPAGSHADFAAVDVLTQVLGDVPSGRLHKALVETKLAAQAGAFNFQLKEPGALLGYAQVRQEQSLDSAQRVMLRTIDDVAGRAPSAEEVDRAKASILKNIELLLNNSEQVGLTLSETQAMGDWRLLFLHRDRVRKVTPADVQRVAAAYIKPSNRTLGLFYPTAKPERAEIPPAPDVAAMVRDYKGEAAVAAGEAFDPSPANIDARTKVSALPNGMRLSLLPKKTRGGVVNARLVLRYGTEQTLMNRSTTAQFAAAMLDRGTKQRTRQALKDTLDKLKAQVTVSGGGNNTTVNVQTTRENFAPALRLVAEMVRTPSFDAKEFEQLRQEQLAEVEQGKSEPQQLAVIAYQRRLQPYPKGHPLYTPTIDESVGEIKAATLDAVKAFHAEFFGAQNADLAVVGDVDAAAMAKLAGELFGDWKSGQPFARQTYKHIPVDSTTIVIETPDKANAFFIAGLNAQLQDNDPDYAAMALANYMLGGGFLNSRLATRIRQKEGISYGVGSQLTARPLDKSGQFTTFAIYAPENADRLVTAFREEIDRALREGFTADEIEKAKQGWLQQRLQQRANDDELVGTIVMRRFTDRTFASYDAPLEERVKGLTSAQITEAMRRYIVPGNITVVRAGDFKKVKPPAAPTP
jgi:zinc protease